MGEIGTEQKLQLGQVLLDRGIVTEEQIQQALERQQQQGHQKLLGELLVDMGYCSENQIASALAHAYGVPYAQVTPKICDPAVVEILPRDFLEEHAVLPLFKVYDALTVAVSEPSNVFLIDEIERLSNCKVQVVCATVKDIHATLQTYMPAANVFVIDDIIDDAALEDFALIESITEDISELEQAAGQSPVVRLVNSLLYNAVRENASDIHIEPDDKRLRVRYRVDGRLYEKMRPPYQMHSAIVSRIKIMAELDIAQRRLPQDGSIHVLMEGRPIDLRVSVMPGNFGEKVVVRVIDAKKILNSLEALGFSYDNLELFREKIKAPNGIVLVTGPTGSGKNTTLYAALAELNGEDVNICTVEDPVECNIPAVNQFEVHEAAGFTFATALRSLLRQDPDIIMVGEIRDLETASMAIESSLTGHLVLSTLHTNDAPGTLTRLIDMDVEPFLITSAVVAVLAQRLVRVICLDCKEPYTPDPHILKEMGVSPEDVANITFFHGKGCSECNYTGYRGRAGIFELLTLSDPVKDLVLKRAASSEIFHQARKDGMRTLREDGWQKVIQGITTPEEILHSTVQ